MSNTDRIIDYVISNGGKLTPEKITAMAKVVEALGGDTPTQIPNDLPIKEDNYLENSEQINMAEVNGIQIDNNPRQPVKIFRT